MHKSTEMFCSCFCVSFCLPLVYYSAQIAWVMSKCLIILHEYMYEYATVLIYIEHVCSNTREYFVVAFSSKQ